MVLKGRWLLPSFISVFLLSHPAKADSLASWHFDANQNKLDITTDEGVQPRVQLLSNPSRLSIDLPGIILGRPKTSERVGSVIQEIRVGQFDSETTRLVIELAPGYKLDPKKVQVRGDSATHWVVQLPNPERLAGNYALPIGSIAPIDQPTAVTQETIPVT